MRALWHFIDDIAALEGTRTSANADQDRESQLLLPGGIGGAVDGVYVTVMSKAASPFLVQRLCRCVFTTCNETPNVHHNNRSTHYYLCRRIILIKIIPANSPIFRTDLFG